MVVEEAHEALAMPTAARSSWFASMRTSLAAALMAPEWWAMSLAAFLVRGGIVVLILPIVALPTPAGFITDVSPGLEALFLGTPTLEGAVLGAVAITSVALLLALAGMVGSWLDVALVREAARSDDLEIAWEPRPLSAWLAFAIRLIAHVPTAIALAYATVRLISVGYVQFTSPQDPGVPIVDRVLARVPDAIAVVVIAWLAGEVVGGLATRRAAAGMATGPALVGAARQLLGLRGLATFVVTTAVLLAAAVPFALAAGRAWQHARGYLLLGEDLVPVVAAIVVLVATWALGLGVVGAALAWRATAWTAEVPAGPTHRP